MLVGFIRNGKYYRVEDYPTEAEDGTSNAPAQTRYGTSQDYLPGRYNVQSRVSYDRRDTADQVNVLFRRDSARMRGDLDAAARYEHTYNAMKREQFRRDPRLREEMQREWPREPERRLPYIR